MFIFPFLSFCGQIWPFQLSATWHKFARTFKWARSITRKAPQSRLFTLACWHRLRPSMDNECLLRAALPSAARNTFNRSWAEAWTRCWPQLRLSLVIPAPVAALVMRLKREHHFMASPSTVWFSVFSFFGHFSRAFWIHFWISVEAVYFLCHLFLFFFLLESSSGDSVVSTPCRCVLCDLRTSGLVAAPGTGWECACISNPRRAIRWTVATLWCYFARLFLIARHAQTGFVHCFLWWLLYALSVRLFCCDSFSCLLH